MIESFQSLAAFRDVSVSGDTDLEQPSFRSNRSVVEIHVEINGNGETSVKLPLHARYQVNSCHKVRHFVYLVLIMIDKIVSMLISPAYWGEWIL